MDLLARAGSGGGPGAGSLLLVGVVLALVVAAVVIGRRRRDLGSSADRATYQTLHRASLAAPSLREGLTESGAGRSARHLRALLGVAAVALVDANGQTLAWDGAGSRHEKEAGTHAQHVLRTGRAGVLRERDLACDDPSCPVRTAVVAPIVSDGSVVGALAAYGRMTSAGLLRATDEVANWVSSQVELAELDRERTRSMEAELRALRAQISPHFVYNSLAAIASFVRTDPEHARELLLEFADFTRYAFRAGGEFTTLADELRNTERYLTLEKARFGDRLEVRLRVAPEVLQVACRTWPCSRWWRTPSATGSRDVPGTGHITLAAEDAGTHAVISVEDDGVGSDPEVVRRALAGESDAGSVGLSNVDARLRQVFGDDHGLVVETAPGAGMRVTFRVPKFAPGVRAQ